MPSTLSVVDTIVNPESLHELVGQPTRVTRLRVKPGVSVVFALASGDRTTGWGRLLWPGYQSKAVSTERRALHHGESVRQRETRDGLLLQLGGTGSDPRLVEHLAAAQSLGVMRAGQGSEILRYNPLRRLVLAAGEQIVRVTARAQDSDLAVHRLLDRLIPVPALSPLTGTADSVHVSVSRRVGDTDLSRHSDLAATRLAGATLARVHAETGAGLGPARSAHQMAEAHAGLLDDLAPDLAARARRLGAVMPWPEGEPVLSHGDFSPDQVLHETTTGRIWLTDFERACLAPAAADLGSYLDLVDADTGAALLEGYAQAGGRVPGPAALQAGRALAAMARLLEPLRRGEPGWRAQIEGALTRLESSVR